MRAVEPSLTVRAHGPLEWCYGSDLGSAKSSARVSAVVASPHPPRFAAHIPGGKDGHRNRESVRRREGLRLRHPACGRPHTLLPNSTATCFMAVPPAFERGPPPRAVLRPR